MPSVYLEELVGTETEDGLLLDGAVIRPDGVDPRIHRQLLRAIHREIGRALAGCGSGSTSRHTT
ncbi:MAG TPA: hypothetical protein VNL71_00150 [Chloroflexota bacterium]|nr:hypothetical protein [Chloroflexota bacterium]